MTQEQVQKTFELFAREPDSARSNPQATAVAAPSSASPAAVVTSGSFSWRAGLPAQLDDGAEAPSPTTLLLGALASCAVLFLRETLAPQLGVEVQAVKATASCHSDARGLLGMLGTIPDLQHLELDLEIESTSPRPEVERLVAVWRERCPIYLALVKPVAVRTRVEVLAR